MKIYSKVAAATTVDVLPSLTGVQSLFINGAAYNTGATLDISTITGLTSFQYDTPVVATIMGSTTNFKVANQAITLSNLISTGTYTTAILSTVDTVENLTLQAWTWTTGNTNAIDLAGTKIATLNITSLATGTTTNQIVLTNTGTALTKVTTSGTASLTLQPNAAVAGALTSVNSSAATGAVTANFSAAVTKADFAFTGGAGNDTLIVAATEFATLTAGSQLDAGAGTTDTIRVNDTAFIASTYAGINAAKNFERLGFGTATATVDAAQLTSINRFQITTTGHTINSIAAGAIFDVAASVAALTVAPSVGVTASTFNFGTATLGGVTTGALTVTGLTSLAFTSAAATTTANIITNITNSDNSSITITGAGDFTLGGLDATTTGSKVDGTAMTGKLTVTGTAKGDILIGGTNADSIISGAVASTLTGNGGADAFNVAAAVYGAGGQIDTITDFTKATDTLTLAVNGTAAFTKTGVNVGAASTVAGAIDIAVNALAAGNVNAQVDWFQFGGNTYVVESVTAAHATVAATDLVVKLNGLIDLSTVSIAGATSIIS